MSKIIDLDVTAREGTGKGAARAARREHLVPGVIYGGGADPQPINVNYHTLIKHLRKGHFMSTLLNIKLDGNETRAICRAIQKDVVKDLPTHIDLLRLKRTSRINLLIPVEFINEEDSPGIKKGGVLTVVRSEVELMVTAGDIPEVITVDLTGLNIGDAIHISDVKLPEGTRPTITDRDFIIGSVSAPSALRSEDDEDEADEGAVEAEGDSEE